MSDARAKNTATDQRTRVCVLHDEKLTSYDGQFPYLPRQKYPELVKLGDAALQPAYATGDNGSDADGGAVFDGLRRLLSLNCDSENFGSENWNPFGKWIRPGMRVCIKPNLVMHTNLGGDDLFCSIIHPSVIAAAAVYAVLALDGDGEVTICDSSQWNCRMSEQLKATQLDRLCEEFTQRFGMKFTFADLRMYEAIYDQGLEGLVKEVRDLPGDPRGYSEVDLGAASAMETWSNFDNIFGSDYDRRAIRKRHSRGRHVYVVANSVLGADCVINIPKFKTHKKAGLTCAMKNLVGTIGDKNCLPHFRIGYGAGGDESAAPGGGPLRQAVMAVKHKIFWLMNDVLMSGHTKIGYKLASCLRAIDVRFNALTKNKYVYRTGQSWGNWYGNRTIGPLSADLNTIFTHVDKQGHLGGKCDRAMINIVDGIIAGEGDGPLSPTAKPLGVLMFSENTCANDYVVAALMGFDRRKIHSFEVVERLRGGDYPISPAMDAIDVISNDPQLTDCLTGDPNKRYFALTPHVGWIGCVERDSGDGGKSC